jgi:hypothetical protein
MFSGLGSEGRATSTARRPHEIKELLLELFAEIDISVAVVREGSFTSANLLWLTSSITPRPLAIYSLSVSILHLPVRISNNGGNVRRYEPHQDSMSNLLQML